MGQSIKIDCFLDEELGMWVLDQLPDSVIGNVLTHNRDLLNKAKKRGLRTPGSATLEAENRNSPILLSVHWPKIFKPVFLDRYDNAYNIHQGLLPWCKGVHPAFWAMWTGVPAGATLHRIDKGIDTGEIVDQSEVPYGNSTTLAELVKRIDSAEKALLSRHLPGLIEGNIPESQPQTEEGSHYSVKDYVSFIRQCRTQWKSMRGEEIVRLLRCTSALPIEIDGRFFNASLQVLS